MQQGGGRACKNIRRSARSIVNCLLVIERRSGCNSVVAKQRNRHLGDRKRSFGIG